MAGICTRSVTSVWLVGGTTDHFKTSKLPSRGEVLKVLFHYHINEKMSLKDSIEKTASMLLHIWEMARIITKAPAHVIEHMRKLHAEWQGLKKHANRNTAANLSSQNAFQDRLEDLFDIAHRDAMSLIKIEEDRLFLEARDPSQWQYEIEYKKNKDVAQSFKVVNDLAERGVALVQEFNSSLTRNEEQKQYLLQVVEHHRRQFAEPTKAAAIKLSTSANDIDSE